jgi:putative transcriptional regulator
MSTKAERAKEATLRRKPGKGKRPGVSLAGLSPASAKIVSAFNEAIETMQDEGPFESLFTVNTYRVAFDLNEYTPDDVKRARAIMRMSQALFAQFLGVNANTVRSWEQGLRPPSLIARRFMTEIESDPEYWLERVALPAQRRPKRSGVRAPDRKRT